MKGMSVPLMTTAEYRQQDKELLVDPGDTPVHPLTGTLRRYVLGDTVP